MIPQAQKLNIFLSNLLESHNLVTLLNARKTNLDKNNIDDVYWYKQTALELKKINDKLLESVDVFLFLTELLETSRYDKQILLLEPNLTDAYYNFLPERMQMLRRQNKIALELLKKGQQEIELSLAG